MTSSHAPLLGDEGPPRRRVLAQGRISPTLLFFGAIALANAWLLENRQQPVSQYAYFLACASLWVLALPFWMFLVSKRKILPFFAFASGVYATYFVFPLFSAAPLFRVSRAGSAWGALDHSLELVLIGSIAMVATHFATDLLLYRSAPRIRREIDLPRALPFLAIVGAASLITRIATTGSRPGPFNSVFAGVNALGQVATAALLLAWFRGILSISTKALTVVLVLSIAVIGLASGMLANVALALIGVVFIYGWEHHRIPWLSILLSLALLAPFNAAKQEFRHKNWSSNTERVTSSNITTMFTNFLSMTAEELQSGRISSQEIADPSRTNFLGNLALVVSATPEQVPFWGGETYADLAWHLVPRLLVPDKPEETMGQIYPHRYEFTDYGDDETSWNLPQFTELFINFGTPGVFFGMMLIGFIYALLNHIFSASSGGAVIGAVVFSVLMNIEGNFSLVFGGLPFMIILYYGFVRLLPAHPLENQSLPTQLA